jgi:hypothetical protein
VWLLADEDERTALSDHDGFPFIQGQEIDPAAGVQQSTPITRVPNLSNDAQGPFCP